VFRQLIASGECLVADLTLILWGIFLGLSISLHFSLSTMDQEVICHFICFARENIYPINPLMLKLRAIGSDRQYG